MPTENHLTIKTVTMEKQYIIAVFDDEDHLFNAVAQTQQANIPVEDIFTPFPIPSVMEMMNIRSRFSYAAFFIGTFSALAVLGFLYYTAVLDWPLNFGGKPSAAFPSFIIVTLILTILMVTIGSLLIFSVRARIYPGKEAIMPDCRSTDDKFILMMDPDKVNAETAEKILRSAGATEIRTQIANT